ncbi:MAG: D-amino-acid transaminase [Caldiserica bacterium]|nr:D-amino-acid transaminase [Caldisericota bacterium]MDH7561996.1 D-amino-acid transaminase [Caldisericota bacterium]
MSVIQEGLAWINGEFLPLEKARVSVEDRGFQFADGIYEVIRVYDGKPFTFREHLERLKTSAFLIGIDPRMIKADFQEIGMELISRSGIKDAELYIQITRGRAPRSHVFPKGIPPTVLISIRSVRPLPLDAEKNGISAITYPDIRWARCNIKSISLLANVLAKEEARNASAYEAIFIREGLITEGASSNIFLLHQGVLLTPPADWRILRGITRDILMALAIKEGIKVSQEELKKDLIYEAEEVFITSTAIEILPVVKVDGRVIGKGTPGSTFKLLHRRFKEYVEFRIGGKNKGDEGL